MVRIPSTLAEPAQQESPSKVVTSAMTLRQSGGKGIPTRRSRRSKKQAHDALLPQQAVTAGSTGGGRIGGGGSFLRRFGGTGEPLTTALLSAAYKEVPSGAEKTIEQVVDCWRTSKLRGLSHGCWQLDLPSWGINMKK